MKRRIGQIDRDARARATIRKGGSRGFVIALAAVLLLLLAPLTASAQDDWAPPRTVLIPETGHTIDGVFLDVWREWGGVTAFGNPITPELKENGRIVQYYEYARLEYANRGGTCSWSPPSSTRYVPHFVYASCRNMRIRSDVSCPAG